MPIAQATDLPEQKKPKKAPIVEAAPQAKPEGFSRQRAEAKAEQTVRQVQHEVRQEVFRARAINQAISDRAEELSPHLLAKSPALAAELLLGPTPTAELGKVSHAAYSAWRSQQQAYQVVAQGEPQALVQRPDEQGKPMYLDPTVVEYAHKADQIGDPGQEALFEQFLTGLAHTPPGAERDAYMGLLPDVYAAAVAGLLDPGRSTLQQTTGGIGMVLSAPLAGFSWLAEHAASATGGALSGLPGGQVIGEALKNAPEAVEAAQATAGTAAQYVTRNVEGAAVAGFQSFLNQRTLPFEDYYTSWSEAKRGGHSPVSAAAAANLGIDVDDPRYQGLFDVTDMVADLETQTALMGGFAEIKAARTQAAGPGAIIPGEEFVQTFGRKVVGEAYDAIKAAPEGQARAVLGDRFRGINPSLARELARATTKDDVARVIADHIDRSPTREIPRVQAELDQVRAEMRDGSTRLYHGTKAAFEEFDPARAGEEGLFGPGLYATDSPAIASAYAVGPELVRPEFRTRGPVPNVQFRDVDLRQAKVFKTTDAVAPEMRATMARELEARGYSLDAEYAESFYPPADVGPIGNTIRDTLEVAQTNEALYLGLSGAVSKADLNAILKARGYDAIEYEGGRYLGGEPHRAFSILDEGILKRGSAQASLVKSEALRAQEVALQQRIADLQAHEVTWEFPRAARMQAFMRGTSSGWTSRMLHRMFGETGAADLSKFSDDLSPKDLVLYDPSSSLKPNAWASHNLEVLRKQFNLAKVPKELQRSVAEAMSDVRTPQDFYLWRVEVSKAFEEGLTRGGKRALTPEGQRAIRFSDDTLEERMASPVEVSTELPDGTRVTQLKNALEDRGGNPLPSQPSQFIGHARMPDLQLLQDASSSVRYFDRWAKGKPGIGKVYGALRVPLDVARFAALQLPRLVLRPLLLVSELPRLALKIQLDQGIRNFLMGYKPVEWSRRGVDFTDAGIPIRPGIRDLLPAEGETALGTVASEMAAEAEAVTTRVLTRNVDPILNERLASDIGRGSYDHIVELANDELARKVAAYGPEGALQYLADHPSTRLGRWYRSDMRPLLTKNGVPVDRWLANKSLEIDQATGRDPALREAIATGEWRVGRPVPTGVAHELQMRMDELAEARDALGVAEDGVARNELSLRVEDLEQKVGRLQRQTLATDKIKLSDRDAVVNEVLNRWRTGEFQMPSEVVVRRRLAPMEHRPGTLLERARARAQRTNRFVYQSLKPLSKADLHLTRGSTYRQALERAFADLQRRGYGPAEALEIAQHRAAYIAKDLHYDITARSSLDRTLHDYFWFAPVWREQLLTYLWKIPNRSYWPVGILLEYGMAHTLVQGLKQMGFVTDEVVNAKGDTAPYFRTPWGQISVGGLNPLTPGTAGTLPTLSPGAEAILDLTAKHAPKRLLPFFEAFAEQFTFDGDVDQGPNFVPRPIMAVAEVFGVHAPMDTLSLDAWREAERKANVQAARWAMSDLAADGVMPPTLDPSETPEEQAGEMADYRAKVKERAHTYERGLGFIHVLGAAVLPGSVRKSGVTPAGEAFYAWRDGQPDDQTDDEYFAAQDAYLARHPEAWPYSVGARDYSGPKTGDYWLTEAYRSSPTMEPGDYIDKAIQRLTWGDDAPAEDADPEQNTSDFEALSPRQRAKRVADWSTSPVGELSPVQADAVGLPDFEGREHLLATVGTIEREYERQYSYDLPDSTKDLLASHRDYLLERAAGHYGEDGKKVLSYINATPAERLNRGGYFSGRGVDLAISEAGAIRRHAVAAGFSPQGAAVGEGSYGVLDAKVTLYRSVERLRKANPAFDRELRYVELGLGERDGPRGRVAAYEYVFFNSESNFFGYQDAIVQAMGGA
jgi:hypothetical protein